MITVAEIPYTAIQEQPELLAEYAAECRYSPIGEVNPQWEMYERMEKAGLMQAFSVSVDGLVAGFAVVLLTVLPHYGVKAGTVETLFVGKAARRTTAGGRLMFELEKRAKALGCTDVIYSARAGSQLEDLLGKRKQYTRTNSVFCRHLS